MLIICYQDNSNATFQSCSNSPDRGCEFKTYSSAQAAVSTFTQKKNFLFSNWSRWNYWLLPENARKMSSVMRLVKLNMFYLLLCHILFGLECIWQDKRYFKYRILFKLVHTSGESRTIFLPERCSICQYCPKISAINEKCFFAYYTSGVKW